MTKKQLIELGFKKCEDPDFHYYTYDFKRGSLWLFTSTSKQYKSWKVYLGDDQVEVTYEQIIQLKKIFR
jgi:hypothetical protein